MSDVYRKNLRGRQSKTAKNGPRKAAFPGELLTEIYTTAYSNYSTQIDGLLKVNPKYNWRGEINTCVNKKLQKLNIHFRNLIAGTKYDNVTSENLEDFKECELYRKYPTLFEELDKKIDERNSLKASAVPLSSVK